ncbi:hypothetical protein ACHJH3_08675 [Campylobacter sp. MOP7]
MQGASLPPVGEALPRQGINQGLPCEVGTSGGEATAEENGNCLPFVRE